MSQDVLQIIKKLDSRDIEIQLALQCGPLITVLKIANLLITEHANVKKVKAILKSRGISYCTLYTNATKTYLILFKPDQLLQYLSKKEVRAFLEARGYTSYKLSILFALLKKRYTEYMEGGDSFPHEFGLFLGYPVEDVIGFIEHNGKNYLYTGYWKVYSDVDTKRSLFEKYEASIETLIPMLDKGVKLVDSIDLYSAQIAS